MSTDTIGPSEQQCRDLLRQMQRELINLEGAETERLAPLLIGPEILHDRETFFESLADFAEVARHLGWKAGFAAGKASTPADARGAKGTKATQ